MPLQTQRRARPVAIDLGHKTDATGLVEEAMILANETVARHLSEQSFPSLYRVHEQPAPDNLAALVPAFQEFPWFAQVDAARLVAGDPHAVQQALAASSGRSEGELGVDAPAALHETRCLSAGKRRPLRPCECGIHPFHKPYQALSRPWWCTAC